MGGCNVECGFSERLTGTLGNLTGDIHRVDLTVKELQVREEVLVQGVSNFRKFQEDARKSFSDLKRWTESHDQRESDKAIAAAVRDKAWHKHMKWLTIWILFVGTLLALPCAIKAAEQIWTDTTHTQVLWPSFLKTKTEDTAHKSQPPINAIESEDAAWRDLPSQ